MFQLFSRIELIGSPSREVYEQLHAYMSSRNWYTDIIGDNGVQQSLPPAEYQARFIAEPNDLIPEASRLKAYIEANIWPRAKVLMTYSPAWAVTAA